MTLWRQKQTEDSRIKKKKFSFSYSVLNMKYTSRLVFEVWLFSCIVIMPILLSHFSRVWPCVTHRRQPTRLPRPWDSPGKNTGVGCHVLLQCIKVKSESEVSQSCLTLSDPMDCSPPGSSAHGIFQARLLEWGAIAFKTNMMNNQHISEESINPRI